LPTAPDLKQIGTGRSADVFEHGRHEVLRRYRTPRDTGLEVAAMEHARVHGYPVPAARALNDTDMVMDRVEGSTMLGDMMRNPWRMPRHARLLATLLDRLHAIPAPDWLPSPLGDGHALLHLDLHPENVILTQRGPVVIDWPNAARGPGAADVTHTWIVLACSLPPEDPLKRAVALGGRRLFLALFLRNYSRRELRGHLPAVGDYRAAHRTLPPGELESISRVVDRNRL
jgi:aminoglycoside phosphotransferase (APT) family kinase protein